MKRYAAVGTGGRVVMFLDPIVRTYRTEAQLVGLCDPSRTRMEHHRKRLMRDFEYEDIPLYEIGRFNDMLSDTDPDSVIVCSVIGVGTGVTRPSLRTGQAFLTHLMWRAT